jgi:hypothetical protein
MRSGSIKPTRLLVLLVVILTACTKPDIQRPTGPQKPGGGGSPNTPQPVKKGSFRFLPSVDLTGQPYHSSNLRAVVSISKANGEQVVKDQLLTLNLSAPVQTATLELPAGDYKLTSFLMEYGSVQTHFAAPITGSVKAAAVQKPLSIDFKVVEDALKDVAIEVLKVQPGETPQQYGYSSGAFDHGQEDANPYMKIKIKAVMKIGNVVYDSIPAALTITTWNDKGEMTTNYGSLAAGMNEIQVLKSGTKFKFTVSKWGTSDEMTLEKKELDLSTVYILGGSKAAKKIKSERTYKQVNGQDIPDTKTDYFYDHLGNLLKIDYWKKKEDKTTYFAMADRFEYNGDKLLRIKRVEPSTNVILSETSFTYNAQGKVVIIGQNENGVVTTGVVEYFPSLQERKIDYSYSNKNITMQYVVKFDKGNILTSAAVTSNHSSELGRYDYDSNINPYIHMNWPDLFLSNSSKNNLAFQYKEYANSFPLTEPYSLVYKYDAEGYPTEVIKNYRSGQTGNFLYSTKTVFIY